MNFQDFFRSFIGLNPRYYNRHGDADENPVNKFRNPPWGDDPDEDDDFDELYSDYRNEAPSEFGFNVFTGDAMQMHKYFEQQMNEMMKNFGSLGRFNFGGGGMEDLMPELDKRREANQDVDMRDKYLKSPVGKPRFAITDSKTDSDIDDRVTDDGIGTLFKKESVEPQRLLPSSGGFTRSFTSRVIISNNGKVEERVKEWSSEGVERERVKRTLGDQIHSVTTSKDTAGQTQTEELINIDQDSLNDFDKKWSTSNRNVPSIPGHHVQNFVNPPPSSSHSIFAPLLRLFS